MASTVHFATNRVVTDPADWTTYGTAMAGGAVRPRRIRDVAMAASFAVNGIQRLGLLGPMHRDDAAEFPPGRFRTVDCTEVWDYPLNVPLDASHQYYRRSPKVRADIAAILAGQAAGGVISL